MPHDEFRSYLAHEADRLAWVNDDDSNDLGNYPGPTWDEPSYVPTPEAAAEDAGYDLGYALDLDARPDSDLTEDLRQRWFAGWNAGYLARRQEVAIDRLHEAERLEWAFGGPDVHPCEEIEAVGVIVARKAVIR